jgi:hypothetical protein
MAGWVMVLVQFVLRGLGLGQKKPDTTVQTLAASNAAEAAAADTEGQANAQLVQAAQARAAADAERVRDDPGAAAVVADPDAAINRDPAGFYRD